MIELPVCCLDQRKVPPGPLKITYKTDFMLPPQKQTLELLGQGEMCHDCAVVWEVSYGPGIIKPDYGPRVVFELQEGTQAMWDNGLARTAIDLYCMDQHLQKLVVWSQCWAYSIFEAYRTDRYVFQAQYKYPRRNCFAYIAPLINYYDCRGSKIKTFEAGFVSRGTSVITEVDCKNWYEGLRKEINERTAINYRHPWGVPRDYRDPRAIALGCKGYGE